MCKAVYVCLSIRGGYGRVQVCVRMAVYVSVLGYVCVCVCMRACESVCSTYTCVTVYDVLWLHVCDCTLMSVRECILVEVLQICV